MTLGIRSLAGVRLFRFLVVGAGAACLLFVLSWGLVAAGFPPFPASVAAYGVAFAVAYTAQRGWTFGGRHGHGRALPRYFAVQLGCALLSGLVSHIAVTVFGASPLTMSAVTTIVASAASYVLSSRWVFPEGD